MDFIIHFVIPICLPILALLIFNFIVNQKTLPSYSVAKLLIKVFKVKEPKYFDWLKAHIDSQQYPIILHESNYEFIPNVYLYLYLKQITSFKDNIKIPITYRDLLWISKWVGGHNNKIR